MTTTDTAAMKLQAYLTQRAQMKGLHQEEIHSMHVGDPRECLLCVSDLAALLADRAAMAEYRKKFVIALEHIATETAHDPVDEARNVLIRSGLWYESDFEPRTPAQHKGGESAALPSELPELPEAGLWMTHESHFRLKNGGNRKGSVPVHSKRSATSIIPIFTADQMKAYALAALKGQTK